MINPSDESWRRDVEIWNAGSQRGFLDGTQTASNYLACQQFLKDLEKILNSTKAYWASALSSLMWDEREALKEFDLSIQDYWKLSVDKRYAVTRRFRENEKLRLSIKYGLTSLEHHSDPYVVTTRKEAPKNHWVTFYQCAKDKQSSSHKIWSYGNEDKVAINNHKECLDWLDKKNSL
jgi:hypothetical protein